MNDKDIAPEVRRSNIRLAIVLGLVAFGFFAAFIYVTVASR